MLQRNVFPRLPARGRPLLRSVFGFALAALLASSCTVSRDLGDLTAGCPDGTKFCGHDCVALDDPDFGCTADSCDPCPEPENAAKIACSKDQCVVTKCDSGAAKLCGGECKRLDLPEFGCNRPGCEPCFFNHTTSYACNAFGSCEVSDCTEGWADCDNSSANGCESYLREDARHCGFCSTNCDDLGALPHATVACGAGSCLIGACDNGYKDCNGIVRDGCERNAMTDNNNCGGCGKKCSAGQTCTDGKCE